MVSFLVLVLGLHGLCVGEWRESFSEWCLWDEFRMAPCGEALGRIHIVYLLGQ